MAIFGEKSSLVDILRPIHNRYGADIYTAEGDQSATHLYSMAKQAVDDKRPLVLFTLTDCDPSGYNMPVTMGRKLQALLEKLGIPRSSFYRWYDRYQGGGPEALADRPSRPDRVWNRIPEAIRSQIVDLALDQPELSPRELAVRFTDEEKYFVSWRRRSIGF